MNEIVAPFFNRLTSIVSTVTDLLFLIWIAVMLIAVVALAATVVGTATVAAYRRLRREK